MREILFRGKRLDNGKWVYGYYAPFATDDGHYIVTAEDDDFRVDPATVGQYTGLKDKNGSKIFEGDTLTHDDFNGCYPVFWEAGMWWVHCISEPLGAIFDHAIVTGNVHDKGFDDESIWGDEAQSTGNIHDKGKP